MFLSRFLKLKITAFSLQSLFHITTLLKIYCGIKTKSHIIPNMTPLIRLPKLSYGFRYNNFGSEMFSRAIIFKWQFTLIDVLLST